MIETFAVVIVMPCWLLQMQEGVAFRLAALCTSGLGGCEVVLHPLGSLGAACGGLAEHRCDEVSK